MWQCLISHPCRKTMELIPSKYLPSLFLVQGMPLSTILATFYYADLEKRTDLRAVTSCENGQSTTLLQLRFVDDFLFASTSQERTELFAGLMVRGFEEYGTAINRKKSSANFR